MTISNDQFRKDFPEFQDTADYPESTITLWMTIASKRLNVRRFGGLLDQATELFVAHSIVLSRQQVTAAAVGGNPGEQTGLVASDGLDKVSVSYDTTSTLEEGAGHWNLTTYGKQFIRLARMAGSGGIQI